MDVTKEALMGTTGRSVTSDCKVARTKFRRSRSFRENIESVKSQNAALVMQTARRAGDLAASAIGTTRELLLKIKARAVDHMVAELGLLSNVSGLSIGEEVTVGLRFEDALLHVGFNLLSPRSQAIVIEKISAAVE